MIYFAQEMIGRPEQSGEGMEGLSIITGGAAQGQADACRVILVLLPGGRDEAAGLVIKAE